MHLCHWNVIWSNIFMRSTKTSFAIAAVVHIDHVPKVVNIGLRCVDNLSFQPQIDTDLRFNIHVWYESNNIWTNNEILLRLKKKTDKTEPKWGRFSKATFRCGKFVAGFWKRLKNLQEHGSPNFLGLHRWLFNATSSQNAPECTLCLHICWEGAWAKTLIYVTRENF